MTTRQPVAEGVAMGGDTGPASAGGAKSGPSDEDDLQARLDSLKRT